MVAAGQGKHPISLLVLHPGAAVHTQEIYIFTHTTVQDFLDLLDNEFNYTFEGEIINEIPSYYFMVSLGVHSGSLITKTVKKTDDNARDDDEDYVEHKPREYRV